MQMGKEPVKVFPYGSISLVNLIACRRQRKEGGSAN
jgi:hypothetical protein